MSSLPAIRAANAAYKASKMPVALFLGGTSGVGQAMAECFARWTEGNAHIILCGRNEAAASSIISSFPKPTDPNAKHEFVKCDAVLMKNCHATTKELVEKLPKLNFLVVSPGFLTFKGRDETEEGIDKKLALNYYARWVFIGELMPLLQKAKDEGEDAKVMTVLAAGVGGEIDVNDLGLKKNFSLYNAAMAVPTYSDLMLEEYSARNPDIAFTHIYPGFVRTPIMNIFTHWALKPLNTIIYYLSYPFATSPQTCAEYMWYALFASKAGVYRRNEKGEDLGKKRYFGTEEQRKKLWEHTVEATRMGQ